jgi:UDP-N-acetylmuramyl pentapeptide synthase
MQGLSDQGIAILNDDDPGFAQWSALAPGRILSFGTKPSADIQVTILQSDDQCSLVAVRTEDFEHTVHLPLNGQHNVLNLAAAIAVMVALKLPDHLWLPAIADIKPARGRLVEHQWQQWTLIDDTYNASPESVLAAIEVLAMKPQPRILVLGELRELGSETQAVLREIGQACRHRVDALWTLGQASRYASGTFGRQGRHFDSAAELLAALELELQSNEGGCILMKGSRAAAMDALLRDLMEALKFVASN